MLPNVRNFPAMKKDSDPILFTQKIYDPIFFPKNISDPNFFWPKKNFDPKKFPTQIFMTQKKIPT